MTQALLARGRLADHPVWRKVLVAEELAARLVLPLIVADAVDDHERVEGAGGLERISVTEAVRRARGAVTAGIAGVLVFGVSDRKDENAVLASQPDHVVPRAVRAIKDALPDLAVATDVCVCAYTTHGQCVLFAEGGADIAGTLERLGDIALAHADSGADLLIPSGMLDGTVAALRARLAAGHAALPVAAMAKVESTLYRTHRIAVGASPIDERAVPLLDPADPSAAHARVGRDVAAGADAVVVKPALLALDLVASISCEVSVPVIAYQTADEHALFQSESDADGGAAERGSLAASRRAGAALIVTHAALD